MFFHKFTLNEKLEPELSGSGFSLTYGFWNLSP